MYAPFGLLLGCRLWIRVGGSKSIEVQKVWDVYDERLQFMSRENALRLDEALLLGNVSSAWMVWSSAAEKALADAFQFAGGPVPDRGLVLGRGMVHIRTVRLGGPVVRSVRRNAADGGEVDDVSLYRDSSAAPVLDLRRKFKAILDLLDAIIRCGASLTRAVELSHLWDCVVRLGPLGSVSVEEYAAARTCGVGHRLLLVVDNLPLLVSVPGVLLAVTVGTSWAALLRRLPSLPVWLSRIGGLCLILLLGLILSAPGGLAGLLSQFSVPHFGLLPGCLLWIRVRVPSLLRFRGFGRFMMTARFG